MALSMPPDSVPPRQAPRGFEEIPDGFLHRFEEFELKGHELEIVLQDETPLFKLRRNLPGNRHNAFHNDISYSLIFPYGDEVLLPYPESPHSRFRLIVGNNDFASYLKSPEKTAPEQLVIQIDHDGTVTLHALPSEYGTFYKTEPVPDQDESLHYVHPNAIEFDEKPKSVAMSPDMVLCLYDVNGKHLGSVFQTPGKEHGYIIVNHDHSRLLALDLDESQPKSIELADGFDFSFRNEGAHISITSKSPTHGSLIIVGVKDRVPAGENARFRGFINGPSHMYGITEREVGKVKPEYWLVDEDSMAFSRNTGRIVVADGLGSNGNGQHAAAMAARDIAHHSGSLEQAIHDTAYALEFLNKYLPVPSDAVFSGVELRGNRADFFSTGDARWYLIFGGKVIMQNKVRSVLEDLLRADKNLSRREVYTNPEYLAKRSWVTTTLSSTTQESEMKQAEIVRNIPIPKGAYIVLSSDGNCLTPKEVAECVEGYSPQEGAERIRARNEQINKGKKGHAVDLDDGEEPVVFGPPRDHFTCVVYQQGY